MSATTGIIFRLITNARFCRTAGSQLGEPVLARPPQVREAPIANQFGVIRDRAAAKGVALAEFPPAGCFPCRRLQLEVARDDQVDNASGRILYKHERVFRELLNGHALAQEFDVLLQR